MVLAPRNARSEQVRDKGRGRFKELRYPQPRAFLLRNAIRFTYLIWVVLTYRPTLIWVADWRVGAVSLPISVLTRKPLVVTAYGSEILLARKHPWSRFIALRVYNRASTIFSISTYVTHLLRDFGARKDLVHMIHLGVDPKTQSTAELQDRAATFRRKWGAEDKKILLTLARLTPRKGQDTAIRALARVVRDYDDVVYIIAGEGGDLEHLERLAEEYGVGEHVIFCGYVEENDKAAYYEACDVFVMLSRQERELVEGFGLTFLEASLHGKPVIGTHHGGVPDAVVNGQTGLLVPPDDDAAAARAILSLLERPAEADRLGRAGRARTAKDFTWNMTAAKYLERLREHFPATDSGQHSGFRPT
jgi:phosphatidyl-myo-inositol dimannoside synthase